MYSFSLHAPSVKEDVLLIIYGACKKQTPDYSQSIPLHHNHYNYYLILGKVIIMNSVTIDFVLWTEQT